jgi:uncharacterized protein
MSTSALCSGEVMHRRLRPRRHRLRYRVFSLLLDLDELPVLGKQLKLLSVNRANVFSFHERDHGDGSTTPLKAQVERWLVAAGLPTGGSVRLLTMPRILGYAFNPLSVFFCCAPQGGLQAIVYEVTSTFGERHHYVLRVADASADVIAQSCGKSMHVSPFLGMELQYRFHVRPPAADAHGALQVRVDVHDEDGAVLLAAWRARSQPLTDRALAGALWRHPALTLKVIAAIHWEALLLWLRRVPLHARPAPAARPITIVPPPPQS